MFTSMLDSLITCKLRNFFMEELKKFDQENLFYNVEIPLLEIINMHEWILN